MSNERTPFVPSRPRGVLPASGLLVITDRSQLMPGRDLAEQVAALIAGGAHWLSLREKDWPLPLQRQWLGRLRGLLPQDGFLSVHASASDAHELIDLCDGLHLPWHDRHAIATIKSEDGRGQRLLLGLSCHGLAALEEATALGYDYALLSPIFASASKPGYGPALGPQVFAAVGRRAAQALPVLGLGGIDTASIATLARSHADGAAIMGAAMRAPSPKSWWAQLAHAWTSHRQGYSMSERSPRQPPA
jgi:thiamine-phosphate pyrophosphorylase